MQGVKEDSNTSPLQRRPAILCGWHWVTYYNTKGFVFGRMHPVPAHTGDSIDLRLKGEAIVVFKIFRDSQ